MAEEVKETTEKKPGRNGKKKGFLPGMAPANSKALDRQGEAYYARLREWQGLGKELEGMREEILARMKVEKLKTYTTPDGVELIRLAKEKLSASKKEAKEPA